MYSDPDPKMKVGVHQGKKLRDLLLDSDFHSYAPWAHAHSTKGSSEGLREATSFFELNAWVDADVKLRCRATDAVLFTNKMSSPLDVDPGLPRASSPENPYPLASTESSRSDIASSRYSDANARVLEACQGFRVHRSQQLHAALPPYCA